MSAASACSTAPCSTRRRFSSRHEVQMLVAFDIIRTDEDAPEPLGRDHHAATRKLLDVPVVLAILLDRNELDVPSLSRVAKPVTGADLIAGPASLTPAPRPRTRCLPRHQLQESIMAGNAELLELTGKYLIENYGPRPGRDHERRLVSCREVQYADGPQHLPGQ